QEEEKTSEAGSRENNMVVDIGSKANTRRSGQAILSGRVMDRHSREPVIGATVYAEDTGTGTVSNASGNYYLKLTKGTHRIIVRCIGKKDVNLTVNLFSDGELNILMDEKVTELKAVEVTAQKYHNIESTQMGLNRIDTKMMARIPKIGETDVLKVSLLLPGVQSVGEGTTGFNVRGGNADQNLILLDKAPVFNPSHLMGFFSAFNADIIRDFELHKSVVPAKMGGRLSSVLDLTVKNGNKTAFSGHGGVSPLTGNFEVEAPIVKEKLSFLVSGRSTYSNWILKHIKNPAIRKSEASFNDFNVKLDYELNKNNSVSISGYFSDDYFYKNNRDTSYYYGNRITNIEWKHRFSPQLHMSNNLIYSNYKFSLGDKADAGSAYNMNYYIDYYEQRSDFTYFWTNNHLLNFGISNVYYDMLPGELKALGNESLIKKKTIENEHALRNAIYVSDEYKVNNRLTINGGLRFSLYNYVGPGSAFVYRTGLPTDLSTLKDTLTYDRLKSIKTYSGLEPRISARYLLSKNLSVKMGYARMKQYIHIMSNTFSVSPTDTWKLSDNNISPQIADQFSLGFYRNFKSSIYETSFEVYYKRLQGLKDYKVAATLLMNEHVETEIIDTRGKAYGVEVLLRKTMGKLNGWLSYTYSRILEKSDGIYTEEKINNNQWFPAIYDKPHSLAFVGNYRFSRRFSVSTDVVYSTGRPITYPVARYRFRNGTFLNYSRRNEYRVDDYFRWDISLNLDGNLKVNQFLHSYWSLSVYNITGRNNIYSVYFISKENSTQGYKMSIFAEPIVTLSYNFRF
ncbi:MAG TPA: TonB-dependent receptor, partial [Bacteroidales bacterium]|nr:TonB-dependent receptor [Bacteroidales bacterium]